MRKYLFKCDGCDVTLESNLNQLPPDWKSVKILTCDRADCCVTSMFELCDECAERLSPTNWPRSRPEPELEFER